MRFSFTPGFPRSFLLTVTGCERCVAICFPSHYNTLVTFCVCVWLVVAGGLLALVVVFCQSHQLHRFFCHVAPPAPAGLCWW